MHVQRVDYCGLVGVVVRAMYRGTVDEMDVWVD
jgi:hypothetical protein